MVYFKCKMCGGDLNVTGNEKVVECEYCGSRQTVATAGDEKKVNLFNRANRLRIANDFDKAAGIYENIIAEFPEEAEAYWGLCLCNYGIEYVDDPATGRKIPTCHRASFEKMRKDENYELALENADLTARIVYEDQAREIDRIMSEILALCRNEQPYDIFICYKETDNRGNRTPDSVLAQDIYDALTSKGYRVFFSRITLEDKLGTQYEPYIFSALNSAKMMLVVGTDYEYFNAVWVRNEWSRYLKLMAKDKSKMLIPCYRNMDPYDMPVEFKALQSQDCGKLGFMQDLSRGIDKILDRPQKQKVVARPVKNSQEDVLLKRAFMFLEDGDWAKADEFCEKVLNISPECAEAYLGKLMIDIQAHNEAEITKRIGTLQNNANYKKVILFGRHELKARLEEYDLQCKYNFAVYLFNEQNYESAKILFEQLDSYKKSLDMIVECQKRIEAEIAGREAKEFEEIANKMKHEDELSNKIRETEDNQNKMKKKSKLMMLLMIPGFVLFFLIVIFFAIQFDLDSAVLPIILGIIPFIFSMIPSMKYAAKANSLEAEKKKMQTQLAEIINNTDNNNAPKPLISTFPNVTQIRGN